MFWKPPVILKQECLAAVFLIKMGVFLGIDFWAVDVPEEASVREAETTYSIPAWLVEQEYGIILADIY